MNKKILIPFFLIVFLLPNLILASSNYIELPSNFISSILSWINEVFGDIWNLVALIIGLPLAFWAIWAIIKIVGWWMGKPWGQP